MSFELFVTTINCLLVLVVIFALSVFIVNRVSEIRYRKEKSKNVDEMINKLPEQVAEILLQKADDEKPIMLNVNPKHVAKIVKEEMRKEPMRRGL